MQVITTYTKEYSEKYKTTISSVCGVQSIKLRAANGNTICIHEINGELVIKNE